MLQRTLCTVCNLKCWVTQDTWKQAGSHLAREPQKPLTTASAVKSRFISRCTRHTKLLQPEWPAEPFLMACRDPAACRHRCCCWESSAAVHPCQRCPRDRPRVSVPAWRWKPLTVHEFGVNVWFGVKHSSFSRVKMWPFGALMEFREDVELLGESVGCGGSSRSSYCLLSPGCSTTVIGAGKSNLLFCYQLKSRRFIVTDSLESLFLFWCYVSFIIFLIAFWMQTIQTILN